MTKKEYRDLAHCYAVLVTRLEECLGDFYNEYDERGEDEDMCTYLERSGHWIGYDLLSALDGARFAAETIAGRALARSLAL